MSLIVPPLVSVLADLPDVRQRRGMRHPLLAVLQLACVALRCGARRESAVAEWAAHDGARWRGMLGFTHPAGPSQASVPRIVQGIAGNALETRLADWAHQVLAHVPVTDAPPLPCEAMAIAGKTLRGSAKAGAGDAHLLSAFGQRLGVVLGHVAAPRKTNEITAIDELLCRLAVTGWVVTTAARFTQPEIAQALCVAGGDYLMALKGNPPTLHDDVALLFADAETGCTPAHAIRLHGRRLERRVPRVSTELTATWTGRAVCRQSGWSGRSSTRRPERPAARAYAITSLPPAVGRAHSPGDGGVR